MSDLTELTDQSFNEFVTKHEKVVVDVWAPWCGPCRSMHPVLEKASIKFQGIVTFAKLNSDENSDTATKFEITSIPRFLIFNNGQKVGEIRGAMPQSKFEEEVKKILKLK